MTMLNGAMNDFESSVCALCIGHPQTVGDYPDDSAIGTCEVVIELLTRGRRRAESSPAPSPPNARKLVRTLFG